MVFISLGLIFAFVSYFFTWQADQSIWSEMGNRDDKAENWLSKVGAYLGHIFVYKGFGIAMFIPVSLLLLTGFKLIFNLKKALLNKWF